MRFFASVLLIIFLSTNILPSVFASTPSSLQRDIQSSERILDTLVDRVDMSLDKANIQIKDPEQSAHIEEKQKEIEVLLEETKKELANADSKGEIKEIVIETKKLIDLKVEAATTPTTDVLDTISQSVQIQKKDITQAKETLLDSFSSDIGYTILLRTKKNTSELDTLLRKYDASFSLRFLFEQEGQSQYELTLTEGSLLRQELFEDIESGEVPKDLFGIEVIQPELFQISDITGESSDKLWGMNRYGIEKWIPAVATQTAKNGKKITIGIVDTGILGVHSDLKDRISQTIPGYDFVNDDVDPTDDQGHGTHVSGTIAGSINGSGVYGVNPLVEIVGLKICDSRGFCPSYAVINALKYARDHRIDILNMSLGARGNPATSPICQAIADITDNGGIVVAAAGNSNVDTSTFVPGGCTSAITVGAVDSSLNRASFSNYGAKVDVAAPGVGVYSSYLAGGYKSMNGTSMATPHIVGIVSLLQTYQGDISVSEIKKLFSQYTIPVRTDAQKPIGSFTDLDALIISITKGDRVADTTKKTEDIKQPTNTGATMNNTGTIQKPALPTSPIQTGTTDQNNTADIAIIDESIGLMIQDKIVGVEINSTIDTSVSLIITGSSDTVQINSADEESEVVSSTLLEGLPTTNTLSSSEGVQINSNDDESTPNGESIDFDHLDRTHSPVIGATEGGVQINSADDEREEIVIDPEWVAPTPEGVQINSADDEEKFIEPSVISESVALSQKAPKKATEGEGVEINAALYCTIYIGGSCGYNMTNALAYNYATSIAGGVQLSIGSNGFTVYGRQVGTSMVYIYSRGYLVHTISVTVQSPPRSLSAQIGTYTLQPGYSTWFQIIDGNGGYSVTSSNPSVIWVSGAGTNYTFSAKSSGTATITYRDQRGYYGSFSMTVTSPPRQLQANISGWSAEVGKSITLTITDGNGGYLATSSNMSVATVANASSSVFTITGKSPGSSRITVRDSRGQSISADITITAPARTLRYTYGVTTLDIGSSSRFTITDGNGGYSVTSSNPAVIAVSGSNTNWSLTAKSAGTAIVTVRDQRGIYGQITYTVLTPLRPLRANIGATTLGKDESTILNITDGNGGYILTSSNPAVIVLARTNPNSEVQWTLRALSAGESTISLRDARGLNGSIKITVRSKDLILDKAILTVEVGSDAYFRVNSGNGGYGHVMSNRNVGWYYDNSSIPSYRVRGVTPGTTILQIRDGAGKVGQVVVTVIDKKATASITDLQFSPSIRNGGMGGIYFEVLGEYREAGIEYHYGDKLQPIIEKFSRESDSLYAAVYALECTDRTTCKVHIKPYTIDTNGKKIYHTNYDGTNYIAVGYDLTGTSIANANEDSESGSGVEINGLKEVGAYFRQVGVSIKRTAIEYRGVYDGSADALSDQLEELKALLDAETYKQVAREIKKLVTTIVNGEYDVSVYLKKFQVEFSELYVILDRAYSYLGQLTSYQKQYYGSYLSISSAISFIGPGKLKGTKALEKVEKKAVEAIQTGRAVVLAKGIKSIDAHVFTKHKYGANLGGSEFFQGANIEAVIKEGYGKSNKRFVETMSGTRPSINVEVDMGRIIGKTNSKDTTILRVIVDYDGNVISSYPISNFSI